MKILLLVFIFILLSILYNFYFKNTEFYDFRDNTNYSYDEASFLEYATYVNENGKESNATGGGGNYQGMYIGKHKINGQRTISNRLKLIDSVYNFSGKSVLDIGCNSSEMLFSLTPFISSGVGIDFDPKRINLCNLKKRIENHQNLSFFVFNLKDEPLDQIFNLIPQKIDIVLLLAVCNAWIYPCNSLINIASKIANTLIIEINGKDQDKTIEYLKTKYTNVKNITNIEECKDCINRQLIFCSYENIKGEGKNISIIKKDNIYQKTFKDRVTYNKEKEALENILKYDISPKFTYDDNELILYLEDCGEKINSENKPIDYNLQFDNILKILSKENMFHNDLNDSNILVDKNNKIRIIDFEHVSYFEPVNIHNHPDIINKNIN